MLSKIPRDPATDEMMEIAGRLGGMRHIVTAKLHEDTKILQLTFYEVEALKKGKPEAAFRTFLSDDDYITQDLKVSKVKWLTSAFANMWNFSFVDAVWDRKTMKHDYRSLVYINSDSDMQTIENFFEKYLCEDDNYRPWKAIHRFQAEVLEKRLAERHRKELEAIDAAMAPFTDPPQEFFDWVWKEGMSFSRYLIYKEVKKGQAECECTHCGKIGIVNRKEIRMRNNEKGVCPFCGSKVTYKARGRMPGHIFDERWFLYVDPTPEGFALRYFKADRSVYSDTGLKGLICKSRVQESIYEYSRALYKFPGGKPMYKDYEWGAYKQRGGSRWCPGQGNIYCMECILYPGNLPQAWEHTPMKYSALEILSSNIPTVALRYEDAIEEYIKFPKLEWICKMGLNNLAKDIIMSANRYHNMVGKINRNAGTIFEILGLTKVNTRILQEVDGDNYILRLLQVSQKIGLQFKPEQLREYYETFECNTELLKQANRKVSLHKLVKYISKESERYPAGERGGWCRYSFMRYKEREDPRIERKRNMAKDWLEYLEWCRKLHYDLDNMFIYMPTNFKKVHDRTAKEYQEAQDRIAAEERRRQEREAARKMKQTKKAMEEIFKKNNGVDAFSITGKGLMLIVPQSADEIKAEGTALHHCVGTYVERVAKGETMILFIRKTAAPDESYYTMEWRDNQVIQCRGFKNCDMTPEVKAFTQVFEKKMLDSINKKKGSVCA